jgi:GT2 family glycosyltransferase
MNAHGAPVISVCIANYNGEALLPDCIDSVLAQQVDANVEIIVHDDASPDGSLRLLASRYPQVRVIASPDNVGFCVANNRIAEVANGEYLLLLNNDAALNAGALQALLSEAARIAGDAILTLPQYDWETEALVDRGCLLDAFYNPVPNLDPQRSDVAYVIGACLWIRRALWRDLGGFPEWLGSIGEDMYLCCQARLRGHPVVVAAGSGYRHRQGVSFGGNRVDAGRLHSTFRRRGLSERNKTIVLMVMTPGIGMWLLLAVHLVLLASEGALLSLLKAKASVWTRIYQPAVLTPITQGRALLAARRREQDQRRIGWREYVAVMRGWPAKLTLLRRHGLPGID